MGGLTYKGKRHLPLPKGPYSVGCTDIMTGYSEKGCFVRLYYPCSENGILEHHERWPHWAPTKDYINAYTAIGGLPSQLSGLIIGRVFNNVYTPAIWDSPPLDKGKPYPLIVFSHGLTACRTTYSANHVELASNGYIVASVEHRDGSAGYTYYLKKAKSSENTSQGTKVEDELGDTAAEKKSVPLITRSISSEFYSLRNKQVHQRAEECVRALDLMKDINDGNPPKNIMNTNCELKKFQGLFDMSKVALMGHSFGGVTALVALSKDSRFRVGLTLDPWMMPVWKEEDLHSSVTQPILFISSYRFFAEEHLPVLRRFEAQNTDNKSVMIRNTTHISQCDIPFIINKYLMRMSRWSSRNDYKDKYIHLDIHNKLMMIFLSKHFGFPIDAGFEAFIDDNTSLIIDGINFIPIIPRETSWGRYYIAIFIVLLSVIILRFW